MRRLLKPGPCKTWTLKNLNPEKTWNMGLKNMRGLRGLFLNKTMRNVICYLKIHRYQNYIFQAKYFVTITQL